jgi:hypothetical protein
VHGERRRQRLRGVDARLMQAGSDKNGTWTVLAARPSTNMPRKSSSDSLKSPDRTP